MRKDVKIGLVVSLVGVVAAGWYYLGRGADKGTIPLGADSAKQESPAASEAGGQTPALADASKQVPTSVRRSGARRPATKGVSPSPSKDGGAERRAPGGVRLGSGAKPGQAGADRPSGEPSPSAPAPASDSAPFDNLLASGEERIEGPPQTSPLTDLLASGRDDGNQPKETTEPGAKPAEGPDEVGPAASEVTRSAPPAEADRSMAHRPFGRARTSPLEPLGPSPAQASGSTPQPGARTHVVGGGDSFAVLAEVYYGSQRYTDFLIRANPQVTDPQHLKVGTVLTIPPLGGPSRATAAAAGVPRSSPAESRITQAAPTAAGPGVPRSSPAEGRTYQVQPGDSFYAIARDVMGDANRWKELLELNSALVEGDPMRLRVGQVLKLPAGSTATGK